MSEGTAPPIFNLESAREILDSLGDAVIYIDCGWRIAYMNAEGERQVGATLEACSGSTLTEAWPAIRNTHFARVCRKSLEEGVFGEAEVECKANQQWFEARCYPREDGLLIQLRECTARKLAQDELRKSHVRLNSMLESIPAGAVLIQGETLTINSNAQAMLGYSKDELRTLNEWFLRTRGDDPEAAIRAREQYEAHKQRGFQQNVIRELITKQGETRIVDTAAFVDEVGEVWLFHDVTERLASEEKFRVLFEQTMEAHVLLNERGIIDANQAAMDMLGCRHRSEILGRMPSDFSPGYQPDGSPSSERRLEINEVVRQKGHGRFEWTHQALDGRLLPCEVTITQVSIAGKPAQLVAWRDLTSQKENESRLRRSADELRRMAMELRLANEKLIEARDAALESAMAKSRFLAMVSHEIRTPLNGVMGMTNLLLRTDLNSEQAEYVRTIQTSGQTLLRVIGDVLDLSKAEAGKLTIVPAPIDLARVISEVVSLFQGQAFEKKLRLELEGIEEPLPVLADAVRFKQILGNLVMNALKFTPTGGVLVRVEKMSVGPDVSVEVSVEDTGIGIANDRLESIFDSFTQEDTSTHRMFGGTGLGLTITRRLVDLMGGTINVDSLVGKGSTFTFKLRFERSEITPIRPTIDRDAVNLRGLKVLVVEDNPVNVLVARRMLEMLHCEVTVAISGESAITAASSKDFDVILMDLHLPDIDGFAVTEAILRDKPTSRIIALTANAMEEDRAACLAAGMVGFLSKPFSPMQLVEVLSG